MNTFNRTITGGIIFLFGVFIFSFVGFIDGPKVDFFGIAFGLLICIIGLIILFNKNEDKVEEIKKIKGGKKK